MPHSNSTLASRHSSWSLTGVMALVLSYVLSLAPMQWWLGKCNSGHQTWHEQSIYFPLDFLADQWPTVFGRAINWYAQLFGPYPYRTHGGVI